MSAIFCSIYARIGTLEINRNLSLYSSARQRVSERESGRAAVGESASLTSVVVSQQFAISAKFAFNDDNGARQDDRENTRVQIFVQLFYFIPVFSFFAFIFGLSALSVVILFGQQLLRRA